MFASQFFQQGRQRDGVVANISVDPAAKLPGVNLFTMHRARGAVIGYQVVRFHRLAALRRFEAQGTFDQRSLYGRIFVIGRNIKPGSEYGQRTAAGFDTERQFLVISNLEVGFA